MNDIAYKNKRDSILSKFDKAFVDEFYPSDPMFHNIVEALIKGTDPNNIIVSLLKARNELLQRVEMLIDRMPDIVFFKEPYPSEELEKQVTETISHGGNLYKVIEMLLENRSGSLKRIEEIVNKS